MTESDITSIVNCTIVQAPQILSVFSATMTSILGPIITMGNFLVILSVIWNPNKDLRTPFNFFAVNLAVADLVVGLLTCPLSVATHIVEAGGTVASEMKTLRQSLHFSYFVSVSASLLNLAALCIDRFIAIRYPLVYRVELSFWHHVLSAFGIWLVALTVPLIYFRIGYEQMTMIMVAFSIIFTFVVMLFTICMLYVSVRNRPRNASRDEGGCDVNPGLQLEITTNRSKIEADILFANKVGKQDTVSRRKQFNRRRSSSVEQTFISNSQTDELTDKSQTREHRIVRVSRSVGAKPSEEAGKFFRELASSLLCSCDYDAGVFQKSDRLIEESQKSFHHCDLQGNELYHNDATEEVVVESSLFCRSKDNRSRGNRSKDNMVKDNTTKDNMAEDNKQKDSHKLDKPGCLGSRDIVDGKCKGGDPCCHVCMEYNGRTFIPDSSSPTRPKEQHLADKCENDEFELKNVQFVKHELHVLNGNECSCSEAHDTPFSPCFSERSNELNGSASEEPKPRRNKSEISFQSSKLNIGYRKLEVTLLTMLSAFLVCFVPSCAMIFYLNTSGGNCSARHWMRDLTFLLAILNSAVNPFIYAWRLPPFRKAVKTILCSRKNQVKPRILGRTDIF